MNNGNNMKQDPKDQSQQTPNYSYSTIPPKKSYKKAIIGTIIGIVVVIIIVFAMILAYNGSPGGNPLGPKVKITAINLHVQYNGATRGYLGPTSQALSYHIVVSGGETFHIDLTLKSTSLLLTHSIDNIGVGGDFYLDSVNPSLPYSLSSGSSVTFTLTILAPDEDFTGPLDIYVYTT